MGVWSAGRYFIWSFPDEPKRFNKLPRVSFFEIVEAGLFHRDGVSEDADLRIRFGDFWGVKF